MQKIDILLDYIQNNYMNTISVKNMAALVGLTENYLSKYFIKKMNVCVSIYINDLRIERACYLLKTTNNSIEAIYMDSGYNVPSFFYSQFKKRKKCTPFVYRLNINACNMQL